MLSSLIKRRTTVAKDKKTILVVDDEDDARSFVEAVISKTGDFNILTAADGENAVLKAKEELPDLIILDVTMPKKDGFQVFSELRQNQLTSRIPIVMLTGISAQGSVKFSKKDMGEFFGEEPDVFLDKPLDPEKLSKTIKTLLKI